MVRRGRCQVCKIRYRRRTAARAFSDCGSRNFLQAEKPLGILAYNFSLLRISEVGALFDFADGIVPRRGVGHVGGDHHFVAADPFAPSISKRRGLGIGKSCALQDDLSHSLSPARARANNRG